MSNKPLPAVRNTPAPDPRPARTTAALGRALVELTKEQPFDSITVQDILDRAGVSRSTFYAHYRNKVDALHSSFELLFQFCESVLDRTPFSRFRLFPVVEFLDHIAGARDLESALDEAGELETLWELTEEYAARMIGAQLRRLRYVVRDLPPKQQALGVSMLSAMLISMMRWWRANESAMSSKEVDATFHRLALLWLAPARE